MPAPKHIFVLMLENRSFDHLFGFSAITGTDAATGAPTVIDGLTGSESNSSAAAGTTHGVSPAGAEYVMPSDPGHEFSNILQQLCGSGARYAAPYPPISGSGFVDSYVATGGGAQPGEVMRCFDTARQLPVLYTLAQQFAICDAWFSSLPGPTWPNRMFVHAASSGGLDHSPSSEEIVEWETVDGFVFPRGTVFDALKSIGKRFHVYSGDDFPMAAAFKGMSLADVHRIDELLAQLRSPDPFPFDYVFIEPTYNILFDYRHGTSQHPLSDVRDGEALIKTVYEAIRNSPVWESSLLVILWDEHGGFYDHVAPPPAIAPGDTAPGSKYNASGFTFEQYGVRTPALVISPLVPAGTIDHRVYDHASIPATLEALFHFAPLTARDASARSVLPLLSLAAPRTDAPTTLPSPLAPATPPAPPAGVSRPDAPMADGMLPSIVHAAMCQELLLAPARKAEILARVAALQTRQDAMQYLQEVQGKLASL